MSETKVEQTDEFYAEIESSTPTTMVGLARYLEAFDMLYRELNMLVVLHSAELYRFLQYTRDGKPLTEETIERIQLILDGIWSELNTLNVIRENYEPVNETATEIRPTLAVRVLYRLLGLVEGTRLAELRKSEFSRLTDTQRIRDSVFLPQDRFDAKYISSLDPSGLNIASISTNSPVAITFDGAWPILLIVAVIFSGGTVTLGSAKLKLPPIGTGIEALRKALGRRGLVRPSRPPRVRDGLKQ